MPRLRVIGLALARLWRRPTTRAHAKPSRDPIVGSAVRPRCLPACSRNEKPNAQNLIYHVAMEMQHKLVAFIGAETAMPKRFYGCTFARARRA